MCNSRHPQHEVRGDLYRHPQHEVREDLYRHPQHEVRRDLCQKIDFVSLTIEQADHSLQIPTHFVLGMT